METTVDISGNYKYYKYEFRQTATPVLKWQVEHSARRRVKSVDSGQHQSAEQCITTYKKAFIPG
jgi:hypothetical protein